MEPWLLVNGGRTMFSRHTAAILAFLAVVPNTIAQVTQVSAAQTSAVFVFTSIDVPGATNTNAQGINPQGDIVGFYRDATKVHGFVLSEGVYTTIDYPGAAYTDARGINGRGDIVGAYRMPGEPAVNFHGYLRSRDGEFSPIDFPGHTSTIPQRISQGGLVLGCRHDTDLMDTMRGVTINSREPVQVTEVEAFASMHNGVTPDGKSIV